MPETLLDLAFAAAEAASAVGPAAIDVWAAFCRESGIHRAIGTTPLEQHGDDSVGDLLIEEWRRGELPSHFFAVSRFPETIVGVLPDFDAILGGALALSEQDEIVGSPPVPEATKTRLVEEALLTYPFYEWLAREQEKGGLPREWNFRPRVFMEAFREGILPFAKSQLRRTEVLESMLNSGINWLQVDACFWARSNGYWVNIQGSEVDCQVLAASTGVISITNR